MVVIQDAFANLAQVTEEDIVAVTNLKIVNTTMADKVALYARLLSTKEAGNEVLQITVRNLQGEIENIKDDISTLKKSSHSRGAGAINKVRCQSDPKCKREGKTHHPTWWSTLYCCRHVVGGHIGAQ